MSRKTLVPADLARDGPWRRVLAEALEEGRLRDAELHIVAVVADVGSVLVADHFPQDFERDMPEKSRDKLLQLKAQNVSDDILASRCCSTPS